MKQRTIQEAIAVAIDEAGGLSNFAKEVGVSNSVAWQWKSGVRPVPAVWCRSIVKAAQGKVRLQELRPNDWRQYWPDLAMAQGAA